MLLRYTNGAGFDLVFDSVGGANMIKSFEAAGLNAQIATTVSLCELDLTLAHFKGFIPPCGIYAYSNAT